MANPFASQSSSNDMLLPLLLSSMKAPEMPAPAAQPTTTPSTFKPQNPAGSFVGGAAPVAPTSGMTGTKTLLGQ